MLKKPNSFTIYNASAGSGKTFTLVKEYLVRLFGSPGNNNYSNILAITFTNKAVAEMKSRIVDTLYAFSRENCPEKFLPAMEIISKETGLSQMEIRVKAGGILKSILHNYAAFEVSTIDGFTHRVLRSFAKDLGLPLNFEVELDVEQVLREAVDRLLSKAGEDRKLTRVLIDFAVSKADDDKSWDISRDLFEIAKLLTKETNFPSLEMLEKKGPEDFEEFSQKLEEESAQVRKDIAEASERFFVLLENNGISDSDFSGGYCPDFFRKLQRMDFKVKLDLKWQMNLTEKCLYPNKVHSDRKQIMDGFQPEVVEIFESAKQNLLKLQFLKAIRRNLTPLSLLSAIQDEISEIKQDRSMVLISEFNSTIGKTVKDQPAPFIYERLGERYHHYFIDEFQDTSELQWKNLIPLIDHTLISEHPGNDHGSLTLVGDAKQSIYRWRGGKAEQFLDLCREGNPFNIIKNKELLPKNYRSAREIVEFNNSFFKFCAGVFTDDQHRDLYLESSRQDINSNGSGYINISFLDPGKAEEELRIGSEKVLGIIVELEERGIPKRDICILTRRKKEGYAIAACMSEHNIPILSAESLLIARSPKVNLINSVLLFALNGHEKSFKLQILEYLLEYNPVPENQFEFITHRLEADHQQFFDSLGEFGMHVELSKITEVSLYEAVEYIIRSFDLVQDSDAYVQFFLDLVYEYSRKNNSGIAGFLDYWDQKKDSLSIVAPEGEDAVQIMTIHKAKGLEFPVVIYPFANSRIQDVSRESFWMNLPDPLKESIPVGYFNAVREMAEWGTEASQLYRELCCSSELDALNVLYVALTRPVEQLFVISRMDLDKKGEGKKNLISGLLISFLKSIGKWDGSSCYEFGDRKAYVPGERPDISSLKQKKFHSSPTEGNGVRFMTRSGSLWNSKQGSAIAKGDLIHNLFEKINTSADVESVIENASRQGLIKTESEEEIRAFVLEVVRHPELKKYFSGEYANFNEREILTSSGSVLRPDRVSISGENACVIDYKTGEQQPEHLRQISTYGEQLEQMGYLVEKKFLVYLNKQIELRVL